ncbi:MAG: nucleotidyltransferase domain-containing protein [Psychrobacillus sp.]
MKMENRNVVLKALVGSHNYNLATPESDKDYKVFVTPTFEELYKGIRFQKDILKHEDDGNDYSIHDIRKIPDLFFKANLNYLEILSSNDLVIPMGNPELNQITAMKKEIFKMNLPHLFNACKGMYFNKMKLIYKGTEGTMHLVEKFGYDTKQAQHAYRCMKFIVDFEATNFEDFDNALRYSGEEEEWMRDIKGGELRPEVFENFAKHYFESTFINLSKKYNEQPVNFELKSEIDDLIMSVVKRNLN